VSVNLTGFESNGRVGTQSENSVDDFDVSGSGRYVVWASNATDVTNEVINGVGNAFVRDLVTGVSSRVTRTASGSEPNAFCYVPSIRTSARYISFGSAASDLIPGHASGFEDVYVVDRDPLHDGLDGPDRVTVIASRKTSGERIVGNCELPVLSANGLAVAFTTYVDVGPTIGTEILTSISGSPRSSIRMVRCPEPIRGARVLTARRRPTELAATHNH
jgi:hypothetical protein